MISIAGISTSVDEGFPVQFRIVGNQNLRNEVIVKYIFTAEGDFFDDLGGDVNQVKLSERQQTAQVEVATINDTYAEPDGALTLTLLDGSDYILSHQSTARVIISDLADRQQRVEDITLASKDILPDLTGGIPQHARLVLPPIGLAQPFQVQLCHLPSMYNGT